jgi:integrase
MSDSHPTAPAETGKPAQTVLHPTTPAPDGKPAKPNPDFPLFPHAAGYWAKKIRGKLVYFGKWDDPDGALAKYLEQKDDLHAGRKPRPEAEALTVKDLANAFLNHKAARRDSGELTIRAWDDYKEACVLIVERFGRRRPVADLRPDDFEDLRNHLAKRWGPHRLGRFIQYVRSVFKYAYDAELIDRPVRVGPGFKRPSYKTMRLHRAKGGPKLFTAEEVRWMVEGALVGGKEGPEMLRAGTPLRAMILLGINCGFGNADCGNLPLSALNLDGGWIDFPRPKTGIGRRCPLWPETVAALREALDHRPAPRRAEDAGLVFITKCGYPWAKDVADSPVTKETRKLLDALGINGRRNFYTLRHTFRTVADEAKDQPGTDHIMGHEAPHMSSVYRETISAERLRAVAAHVRAWLFGTVQ